MSGGGSSTMPVIPPQLSGMYGRVGGSVYQALGDIPLSEFYTMDPRQFAGMTSLENRAAASVPGLFGASPASQQAFGAAQQLMTPQAWGGVDLSNVGGIAPLSFAQPQTQPQVPPAFPAQFQPQRWPQTQPQTPRPPAGRGEGTGRGTGG
jgi:hypothetical protein